MAYDSSDRFGDYIRSGAIYARGYTRGITLPGLTLVFLQGYYEMSSIGKTVAELETPCFCIDKKKFEGYCEKILSFGRELNLSVRGQTKTHKTL